MVQTIQKISCIFREIFKTFQKIHVNILGTRFNSSGTPLFNNNLLHDKQYVDKVKQHIQLVRDQYERSLDDSAFIDILLMEIRGITILDWLPCLYEIVSSQ